MSPNSTWTQRSIDLGQLVARRLLPMGCTTFVLAWGLTYLSFPFGRDQGIFAWVGEVILGGGLPYRDAWEIKGPATHLLFALSHWLFGRAQWGIRLLDLASLTATSGLIWYIAGKLGCSSFRSLAPAAFWLWYAGLGYWDTAQPDGWATLLVTVAVALAVTEVQSRLVLRLFLAGVAIGTATLFKPFYGTFLLLLLAVEMQPGRVSLRHRFLGLLAMASGALLPGLGILAWFGSAGGLEALVEVQWYYNRQIHVAAISPGLRGSVNAILGFLGQRQVAVAAAAIGIAALGWKWRRSALLVVGWLGMAVGWVLLQRKFYIYHWTPILPPLAMLAARGLDALSAGGGVGPATDSKRGRWSKLPAAILAVAILGFAIREPTEQVGRWSLRVAGLRPWESYYERFGNYRNGDFSYLASLQVANYLRDESEPGETVFIWGIETIVHYLGERKPPNRFGFNHPFTVGPPQLTAKYRQELMQSLYDNEPSWVVLVDNDIQRIQPKTSMAHFLEFPELRSFVEQHYCRDTLIEDFTLLRRCDE